MSVAKGSLTQAKRTSHVHWIAAEGHHVHILYNQIGKCCINALFFLNRLCNGHPWGLFFAICAYTTSSTQSNHCDWTYSVWASMQILGFADYRAATHTCELCKHAMVFTRTPPTAILAENTSPAPANISPEFCCPQSSCSTQPSTPSL